MTDAEENAELRAEVTAQQTEIERLAKERNQLQVRLAVCAVATQGHIGPEQLAKQGDYGWSLAYQDVVDLLRKYEELVKKGEA